MNSTIILSDLHIGDNIHFKRLAAFLEIFENFDRIILNGDFLDDLWSYDKTVTSEWSSLFDLLKRKEVIYLFGNHDRDTPELRAATSDFIDVYADTYNIPVGNLELVIKHGHTIYPRPDGILYEKKKTTFGKWIQKTVKILWYSVYPFVLTFRFLIEKNQGTLSKIQRNVVKVQNDRMKEYAKKHLEPHQILVCGHSHLSEFSPELQFINAGANSYERVEYLSIRDEKMELVTREL
ncbi:MAG: putative phosphodiesterase [Crocinitomicaceae bacterium]|jgi:predicted phosphodiesterase